MELPVHIGTWINSGRNGERQISSGRLSNTNESFLDMTWKRKSLIMISQFHRKYLTQFVGNTTKMPFFGYDYPECRKGWNSGRQSFSIMTYATIPGDCIDPVTSQDRDRVLFERLATPRPAPKVTLKMNSLGNREREDQAGPQGRYGPLHRSGTRPQETVAYHFEHGRGYSSR